MNEEVVRCTSTSETANSDREVHPLKIREKRKYLNDNAVS